MHAVEDDLIWPSLSLTLCNIQEKWDTIDSKLLQQGRIPVWATLCAVEAGIRRRVSQLNLICLVRHCYLFCFPSCF